ncbi:ion transporter [Pseudoalteromonas luteoviolacea]|uniref:Potassium channel protein n=1 Tax=Pseudoalteromonas luteoviolacea DSM 6061 TaxID=1365250 RepID=A0A166YJL1_9GAMM|nr:ion transporter [Pseudoalteromonas luteoviolacea]KZN42698.1 potassium channel protein [Pseudoalteromonas luteoviolacea DSM 6061]MBE0385106.1 voltage-gated potassium channel [Pseudoalteromonas luteoviolacea DSM 6061]TQF69764.1 ion transporter [Pseudoalteromonas luteoviolacea]
MSLTLRQKTAAILEGSGKYRKIAHGLDVFLIALIIFNVIAIVLESVPALAQQYYRVFFFIEVISVGIFCIEYLLRLWCCVDKVNYHDKSKTHFAIRLRYIRSPLAVIDLIAILPTLLMVFFTFDLRFLRVVRLMRIFKLTRYSRAMQLLLAAFKEEASSLMAAFFIMSLVLIVASCGIYLIEHDVQPEKFGSIPAAMWWAMATLTTVGYGDVVPITPLGRFFGGVITLLSMGMVAIPTGLLASSFADQLRKRRDAFNEAILHALVDGELDEHETDHLEALRIQLGLSASEANQAIKLMTSQRAQNMYCRHCGKKL